MCLRREGSKLRRALRFSSQACIFWRVCLGVAQAFKGKSMKRVAVLASRCGLLHTLKLLHCVGDSLLVVCQLLIQLEQPRNVQQPRSVTRARKLQEKLFGACKRRIDRAAFFNAVKDSCHASLVTFQDRRWGRLHLSNLSKARLLRGAPS